MNTVDVMRLFTDGRMSLHDARALMLSMGHTQEDFTAALLELLPEGSIRVSSYERDELHAELFLRT